MKSGWQRTRRSWPKSILVYHARWFLEPAIPQNGTDFPSEWYEGFPMTIVEAFSLSKPVIATRLGSMLEIVEDSKTGLLFEPGDPDDLAEKVKWLWSHEDDGMRIGREGLNEVKEKYTPQKNYETLMDIYRTAIKNAGTN